MNNMPAMKCRINIDDDIYSDFLKTTIIVGMELPIADPIAKRDYWLFKNIKTVITTTTNKKEHWLECARAIHKMTGQIETDICNVLKSYEM